MSGKSGFELQETKISPKTTVLPRQKQTSCSRKPHFFSESKIREKFLLWVLIMTVLPDVMDSTWYDRHCPQECPYNQCNVLLLTEYANLSQGHTTKVQLRKNNYVKEQSTTVRVHNCLTFWLNPEMKYKISGVAILKNYMHVKIVCPSSFKKKKKGHSFI